MILLTLESAAAQVMSERVGHCALALPHKLIRYLIQLNELLVLRSHVTVAAVQRRDAAVQPDK